MKNFVVLIVLSCLLVIVVSTSFQGNCGANSSLGCKRCCPDKSCSNRRAVCRDNVCSEVRPGVCQFQCRCNPGYLRNIKGECVLPDQCPPIPVGK
ncbi:chymotrypsin inhibitor-like [Diabrotica virgifera virgifera]|uniref:Chymotrypsin inhibitor-like n=1 Tax=Diabrotica virgifera virgifera TaxID=50390 RepID=A0A6P7FGH5_DIAVI|nr:chymotrypsin inhibitor-like [Diabrotica virgifera virgifera]